MIMANDSLNALWKQVMKDATITYKKSRLKDLHYAMMRIEISKMDIENQYVINKEYYGIDQATPTYRYSIYEAYKEGYRLGTEFFELKTQLFNEGLLSINEHAQFSDATFIAATKMLRDYGLSYPNCWSVRFAGIKYSSEESMEKDYLDFVSKVNEMFDNNKITDLEKELLYLTANYFHARNKYYLKDNKDKSRNLKTN